MIQGIIHLRAGRRGPLPARLSPETDVRTVASACMEAIYLTHDDDELYIPSTKRARICDDSDVELVEVPGTSQGTSEEASEERQLGDGEDFVVTKQTGQVRNGHIRCWLLHGFQNGNTACIIMNLRGLCLGTLSSHLCRFGISTFPMLGRSVESIPSSPRRHSRMRSTATCAIATFVM